MYVNDPSVLNVFSVPCSGSVILIAVNVSFSMSVSFVRIPGAGMFSVVSSFVVAVSSFATGGSLIDIIVRYTVALLDCNVPSEAL